MKFLRSVGSLAFVLGLFTAIFVGGIWEVYRSPELPWWLKIAIYFLLGGILLVLAVFISGGKQFAAKYYGDITGNIHEDYIAITNQNDPSFVLFRDKLEEDGIKADISEMTVFVITEAAFKYRWRRGEDERIYVIRRNSQGAWDTYLQ